MEQGTSYQAYPPVGPNNGRLYYGFRSHQRLHAVLSSLSYQSSLYAPNVLSVPLAHEIVSLLVLYSFGTGLNLTFAFKQDIERTKCRIDR